MQRFRARQSLIRGLFLKKGRDQRIGSSTMLDFYKKYTEQKLKTPPETIPEKPKWQTFDQNERKAHFLTASKFTFRPRKPAIYS